MRSSLNTQYSSLTQLKRPTLSSPEMKHRPIAYSKQRRSVGAKSAPSGERDEIPRYGLSTGSVPVIHRSFRTGFQNSAGLHQQSGPGFTIQSQSGQHLQ